MGENDVIYGDFASRLRDQGGFHVKSFSLLSPS